MSYFPEPHKSYEDVLVYNTSCKTLIGANPLRIMFDKVHGFIKVYEGTRNLVLFELEKHPAIFFLTTIPGSKPTIRFFALRKKR